MNTSQKSILIGATVILVCMVLFPPWMFAYQPPKESSWLTKANRPAGYHLLFSANAPQDQTALAELFGLRNINAARPSFFSVEIDSTRLILQIVALSAITALLLYILKGK